MAKNVATKTWSLTEFSGRRYSDNVPDPTPGTALDFPNNGAVASDIRVVFNGANMPSRQTHTLIWETEPNDVDGYFAYTWFSYNDGTWHSSKYEVGRHPYPCDGTYEVSGGASVPTYATGTEQYSEIAGLGAADNIATDQSIGTQASYFVTPGVRVVQAATCELIESNTKLRHKYYPDVINHPTWVIIQDLLLSTLESPPSPAFYFGCSDWRAGQPSAGRNDECPNGWMRNLHIFIAALSIEDITTEATSNLNTAQTSAGIASVWYINKNPTPSDITDKSGSNHNPSWANANRPGLVNL